MERSSRAESFTEANQESDFFRDVADNRSLERAENSTLSPIGSSFFTSEDDLSLSGGTLSRNLFAAGGIETVTLGSHSADGDNTILSSNPSSSIPPPPEASEGIFMLSPHPKLTPVGIDSMSTMHTEMYPSEQIVLETTSGIQQDNDEGSLSMASSRSENISAHLSGDHRPVAESFAGGAFEKVASRLESDSSNDCNAKWHDRLVSDSDWGDFRATLKALLPIISENTEVESPSPLPLPPRPLGGAISASTRECLLVRYRAEDILPSEFICNICKDVLVGACIADVNGGSCSVCMSCWEESDRKRQDFAAELDFVWVEESKKCPVYCHALDVAILRIIQGLSDSDSSMVALKQMYYHRLSVWRKTVSDRNKRLRQEKQIRDDELLAKLIQEEERVFWEQRRPQQQTRTKKFFGIPSETFTVIGGTFFALIGIVGLKHASRR